MKREDVREREHFTRRNGAGKKIECGGERGGRGEKEWERWREREREGPERREWEREE